MEPQKSGDVNHSADDAGHYFGFDDAGVISYRVSREQRDHATAGRTSMVKRRVVDYRICVLCLGFSLVGIPVGAQMDVDAEFSFASGLVDLGFSDLADRVVQEVLRLHPDQKDRATRIQGEILVAQRRFVDAEALLQTMPADHPQRHALQLKIANGFFRIGDTDQAQRLYQSFFDVYKDRRPQDPDLLRFYQDAAYQYGQMQERLGNRAAAAESYQRLLNAGMEDPGAARRLQMDLARLYFQLGREGSGAQRTDYLNKAYKLCEDVQWGGYDLWFGQAIGLMANVELARNNEAAARDLLQRYMSDLNKIDALLREQNVPASLSPVASARFLLGELYERQVQELRQRNAPENEILGAIQRALTEYYNVFGKYGTSEWGPEAGTRGRALVAVLDQDFGRKVNIDFGQHMATAAQAQYSAADDLFRQRNFDRAIEEYLRILNAFPEGDPSIRALSNLLLSYAHQENDLYVRMMAEYLAERFPNHTVAANALLVTGRMYVERRNEEMYHALFDAFFRGFPQHERAPALLFDMARRAEQAGDRDTATRYYRRIVEQYPRDRFFLRALFALGQGAYQAGDYGTSAEVFKQFVEASRPGHDRVRGQFLLADSLLKQGLFAEAIQAYGQIVRWVRAAGSPDNAGPEDAERNARLLERSLFFVGYSYGRMNEPGDQVDQFRQRAIAAYLQFLEQYPDSPLAPPAMRDLGAMYLARGDSAAATQTFELLAERYPDSDEGRNALFALVSAAFEINQPDIARRAFQGMIASPDTYSPEEFTRVGQLMLDNGLYEDVIPAYERVVATTDQRQMLELALYGLGSAYAQQENHQEAARVLQDLLARFPNTPFYYDARFILTRALAELGEYEQAMTPLVEIMRMSQDNLVIQRAQHQLGRLQQQQGHSQAALATFQRIALLQDPQIRTLRPIIEQSLLESMDLMMEMEMYEDIDEVAAQYLSDFAQGEHVARVRSIRAEAIRRKAL